MKLILASSNSHKADEFSKFFDEKIISIEVASKRLDVIENGQTFQANALKKAEAYYKTFKAPVLSDDSGITVEALPGELGIHSARFGGEHLDDRRRCLLLLEKLKEVENRQAFFTCYLCFYLSPQEIFFFEGRMAGEISQAMSGSGGFGYDPVFIPAGHGEKVSVACIPDWKKENSHRAQACRAAQNFFQERTGQFT